jgi:hypothetical protein
MSILTLSTGPHVDDRFCATNWTGPINSRNGMKIESRSFGFHFDRASTQRRIGRSVYIFRRVSGGIDVWRLAGNAKTGHYWTRDHAVRAIATAKAEVA